MDLFKREDISVREGVDQRTARANVQGWDRALWEDRRQPGRLKYGTNEVGKRGREQPGGSLTGRFECFEGLGLSR